MFLHIFKLRDEIPRCVGKFALLLYRKQQHSVSESWHKTQYAALTGQVQLCGKAAKQHQDAMNVPNEKKLCLEISPGEPEKPAGEVSSLVLLHRMLRKPYLFNATVNLICFLL